MRRPFAASGLLSLILLLPGTAGGAPAWQGWDAGLREAARLGRPVLVDVYTDWCGWCKRMDRDVYARADVQSYLAKRFVVVKLNAESSARASWEGRAMTSSALAARLGVRGYPNTVFLDAKGRKLLGVPGYLPANQFLTLLRYVADGHLQRGESFEAFARRPAGSARAGAAGGAR